MADILMDKIVKIRKEQVCWGCAEKFNKGTQLRKLTVVDAGEFTTTYWCRICDVTYKENADPNDDGICFGDAIEWDNWHDNARLLPRTY